MENCGLDSSSREYGPPAGWCEHGSGSSNFQTSREATVFPRIAKLRLLCYNKHTSTLKLYVLVLSRVLHSITSSYKTSFVYKQSLYFVHLRLCKLRVIHICKGQLLYIRHVSMTAYLFTGFADSDFSSFRVLSIRIPEFYNIPCRLPSTPNPIHRSSENILNFPTS